MGRKPRRTASRQYDPRDLSLVYVRDPNGRHWPVPYADLGQPPITLWELEEARKELRKEGKRTHAEKAIFANILHQRRIVNEAIASSKQRRRQKKAVSKTKYTCPSCGANAWAKPNTQLICGACYEEDDGEVTVMIARSRADACSGSTPPQERRSQPEPESGARLMIDGGSPAPMMLRARRCVQKSTFFDER